METFFPHSKFRICMPLTASGYERPLRHIISFPFLSFPIQSSTDDTLTLYVSFKELCGLDRCHQPRAHTIPSNVWLFFFCLVRYFSFLLLYGSVHSILSSESTRRTTKGYKMPTTAGREGGSGGLNETELYIRVHYDRCVHQA